MEFSTNLMFQITLIRVILFYLSALRSTIPTVWLMSIVVKLGFSKLTPEDVTFMLTPSANTRLLVNFK